MNWSLLHLDDDLLAVNKPSGLLAVPGRGPDKADCLATRVAERYPDALVVHRLDRDTSGVFLLARNVEVQRRLGRMFECREIHKTYLAVATGHVVDDEGTIDFPLAKDWTRPYRHRVDFVAGRLATTQFRVLARDVGRTWLELRPVTGRSHQLRVHLAALGHAILGDNLYATDDVRDAADRLMLHAWRLELTHPTNGEPLRIEADDALFHSRRSLASL